MKSDLQLSNLLGTVYREGNLVFTSDGTTLLSPVGNRVTAFDLAKNSSYTFNYEHRKNIARITLNPQNTLMLSVDTDGRSILVNLKARTVLHHFNFRDKVEDIKFSPCGLYFAVASSRFVQLWKTPSSGEDRQFAPFVKYKTYAGHYADVVNVTWSRDSRFILSASKDLTTRIWSLDSADKEAKFTFAGHREPLKGAFFSKDQETIYTVSQDGAVFQWEYTTSRLGQEEAEGTASWRITKKNFLHSVSIECVTYHAESGTLVCGCSNGEFRIYDIKDFSLLQQLSMSQNAVSTVSVNSTGEWLAFGSSKLGQLLVYEWQSESYILKQQGHFDATNTLAYSPDGVRIVTGADDGKVKVWDVESGFCLATFQDHSAAVTCVQFAKRGQVVFTASLDGTVRAFDLIRYRNFRTFTSTKRVQFCSLAVDPSGEVVTAGSEDDFSIHVWSVQTGQLVETLSGHEGPVSCLAFAADSGVLASASWDRTIRIWSVFARSQQVEPIAIQSDVLAISLTRDGAKVAVSTLDGHISFWDVEQASQVGLIDGKRDIVKGRHLNDFFTASNSARSKYFTCLDFSFDGECIVAAGNNNSICMYDVANEVLLNRFTVSQNMQLDGTLTFLNSARLGEGGTSLDLIDTAGEGEKLIDRIDDSIPGSHRGDPTKRNIRPSIRVTSVKFSPTSAAFAAASTEGLLIFSADNSLVFDPFDLDLDITPQSTLEVVKEKDFLTALVMAFRLNEPAVTHQVYESIPVRDISIVVQSLPLVYVSKLLGFIGDSALKTVHVEFHLLWVRAILSAHGKYINANKAQFGTCMRVISAFLNRVMKDVAKTSAKNSCSVEFLKGVAHHQEVESEKETESDEEIFEAAPKAAQNNFSDEDVEMDF